MANINQARRVDKIGVGDAKFQSHCRVAIFEGRNIARYPAKFTQARGKSPYALEIRLAIIFPGEGRNIRKSGSTAHSIFLSRNDWISLEAIDHEVAYHREC